MSLVAKMSAGLATRKKSKITRSLRSLVIFLIFYLWLNRHSFQPLVTYQTLIVPTHDQCYNFYNTLVMSALIRHNNRYKILLIIYIRFDGRDYDVESIRIIIILHDQIFGKLDMLIMMILTMVFCSGCSGTSDYLSPAVCQSSLNFWVGNIAAFISGWLFFKDCAMSHISPQ